VHSGASGAQNVDVLFFMLGWAPCGSHKKHIGTSYAELVFLHLMGFAGSRCVLMRSGREYSTHYFSCSCAPAEDPSKSAS
jgi:hypothetical protein